MSSNDPAGFSADWLALREPFDRAARAAAAPALDWPALAAQLQRQAAARPLQVLDLGCGTGASLRALAPRLGGEQHWRLVDHDAALLAAAPAVLAQWAQAQGWAWQAEGAALLLQGDGLRLRVQWQRADLAHGLDGLAFEGTHLVTASALLDLVSAPWLAALVAHCRAAGAAVHWALNVDGRVAWQPAHAHDAALATAFEAHQRRDKGFGPALGPQATTLAPALLAQAGYRLAQADSDWQVDAGHGAADRALLQALARGMADAAVQQRPGLADAARAWLQARTAHAQARVCVGHRDVTGWL